MGRILILVFFVFSVADLSAQVTYNPNIVKQYDSVYKALSPEFKKAANDLEKGNGYSGGIVLCTAFIDDTLNIKDFKSVDTNMKIYADGKLIYSKGKMVGDDQEKKPGIMLMLILNSVHFDTLNIEVRPWVMSNQIIRHKIKGRSVSTTYEEFYKDDNILRANESGTITNDLVVPATTVKFVLSDKVFTAGKTIYGQADVITSDFLFDAAPDFKNNILKHRFHFRYYFKIKVSDQGK